MNPADTARRVRDRLRRLATAPRWRQADRSASADPDTGRTIGTHAITDMAGYYADEHGRVLVRYHVPNTSFPLVAAFAPLALHGAPELSARAAGFTLLRRMIDAWEHHTGHPFINTWAGQLRPTETD